MSGKPLKLQIEERKLLKFEAIKKKKAQPRESPQSPVPVTLGEYMLGECFRRVGEEEEERSPIFLLDDYRRHLLQERKVE